jgi:hypothetical protein
MFYIGGELTKDSELNDGRHSLNLICSSFFVDVIFIFLPAAIKISIQSQPMITY